jgi:tetratricopeptide (TPR) repeat protein
VSSDADQQPDPAGYVQRAELLAELGRYDEAAAELGFALALDSGAAGPTLMLARVHLAGGRPAEALAVAEAAATGAPEAVPPLVLSGLALVDLRRFAEAAQVADKLLVLGPADAYAQRSAAAILAESRNGQSALNAAWRGVELDPQGAPNHLVLSLVAARLGLFDLAERAYREALRLDPDLAEEPAETGVVRLEQRRYSAAIAQVADAAAMLPTRPAPPAGPLDDTAPDARSGAGVAGGSPALPDVDPLRRLVYFGVGYAIVTAVLVAFLATENGAISRVWAALAAVGGMSVLWRAARQVPAVAFGRLADLPRAGWDTALPIYAVLVAPALMLGYALFGTPWTLVVAIIGTAAAQLVVLRRPAAGRG